MGTALGHALALNGARIVLWDFFCEVVDDINHTRRNSRYLSGVELHPEVTAVSSAVDCVRDARLVVFAVPSPFIRVTLEHTLPAFAPDAMVLSVAKGIDSATREPIHCGLVSSLGTRPLVLLAGPAIANEFARGLPAAIVLASEPIKFAEQMRAVFEGPIFRVTTTHDVAGAALGGILKNVYAILLGYVDAAGGTSRNLEAAVLNASLREMAALSEALGAERETIYGLAGLGDLVATGFSDDSHNRSYGRKLGRGRTSVDIERETPLPPEGVRTVDIACAWAEENGISVPLARFVRKAVAGKQPALAELTQAL
jgi:glycerol-3-phosphate dehydrogenase (NAD(P)+)